MSHSDQQQTQRVEQIMTTVITCRSLLKYNLSLPEEQRRDLLHDIDTSLEFLRSYLLNENSTRSSATAPQHPQLASSLPNNSDVKNVLQELYAMYHAYLDIHQSGNINTFVMRFNDVMSTLNEIVHLVKSQNTAYSDYTYSVPLEEPLQRIRSFVGDLYYIFMEFMRVLSNILQHYTVHPETEKLSSAQNEPEANERVLKNAHLQALAETYHLQQQLNKRKGEAANRVSSAIAFLEFLKEHRSSNMNKRDEVFAQLNAVAKLLSELLYLLKDYEKAAILLLSS